MLWEFQSCWTQFCILGTRSKSVVAGSWFPAESCSECLAAQDSLKNQGPVADCTPGRIPMRNAIAAGTVYRVTF